MPQPPAGELRLLIENGALRRQDSIENRPVVSVINWTVNLISTGSGGMQSFSSKAKGAEKLPAPSLTDA
ncbi:MAG TPA: hypothetical protein VI488_03760 [Candidatus Angelobacter sp.]